MSRSLKQRATLLTAAESAFLPARAANPLMAKLRRGKESCVLQVLGDSTGDGIHRWPYLTAVSLAAAYPAYTVNYLYWNGTNLAYDAIGAGSSSTVQTGATPSPATVVDTMTRADSTTSPGNTTDANNFAWFNVFGTHGISSNHIYPVTDNAVVSMSGQYADHTGTITLSATANSTQRLYLRYMNSTNGVQFQITTNGTSGANLIAYRTINGVNSSGTNATVALTYGTDYAVTWSCVGSVLSVTVNGATVTTTVTQAEANANPWLLTSSTIAMLSRTGAGVKWSALMITNQAPTLTVRSGSTSGQICSYSQTNFSAQVPSSPDYTIINYGHNEGFQDCRPQYLRLVDQLLSTYPRTSVAAALQNPRARTDVNFSNGLARMNTISTLATNEGWGIIDACSLFLTDPNYATTLLNTDGLHPSDAGGSPLWTAEVMRFLDPTTVIPAKANSNRSATIFVPAAALTSFEGTPALGTVNGWPSWTMIHGSGNQTVQGFADVPGSWDLVDIYLLWSTAVATGLTGSTNSVYLEALMGWLGGKPGYPVGTANAGTAIASFGLSVGAVANNSIPYTQQATLVANGVRPLGRPILLQARRQGGHAYDTLTQDIYLHGVLIKRAS